MSPAADPPEITIREVRPEEYDALGDLTVAAYRSVGELDAGYHEHIHDVGVAGGGLPGARGRRPERTGSSAG